MAYDSKPVEVELLINGIRMATQVAGIYRQDITDKKIHPTGECGFDFVLSDATSLKPGDEVRGRVVGEIKDLANSPQVFMAS